jgi:hypothetical protein
MENSQLTLSTEDERLEATHDHHDENFYGTTHASGGGNSGGEGSFRPFAANEPAMDPELVWAGAMAALTYLAPGHTGPSKPER